MAKITLHPSILSIHGRIGDIIFYNVCGFQYARSFSMPRNPRTKAQQQNRVSFAGAVKLWQQLSENEKSQYNRMAEGMPLSGYNLFISMKMKGLDVLTAVTVQRGKIKGSSTLTPYMLLGNSVSVPMAPALPMFNTTGAPQVLKKPPGTPSIAA